MENGLVFKMETNESPSITVYNTTSTVPFLIAFPPQIARRHSSVVRELVADQKRRKRGILLCILVFLLVLLCIPSGIVSLVFSALCFQNTDFNLCLGSSKVATALIPVGLILLLVGLLAGFLYGLYLILSASRARV
jgi:hypothetical protein